MKPEFHEDYHSQSLDPLAPPASADFDWKGLSERLREAQEAAEDDEFERVLTAFRILLDWLLAVDVARPNCLNMLGRRLLVFAWVLDHSRFNNTPSLAAIAKQLGFTAAPVLSVLASDVTRKFAIRNRAQAHGWNRKAA